MQEKLKAIEVNLRTVLRRFEQIKNPSKVEYQLIQLIEQISSKINEVSELLQEIENIMVNIEK